MNGNQYQEPAPDLVDSQPEWEVEQILGARKRCQQLQYLVRWKGFSEAHDSWEPLSNINADLLIKDFYHSNPSAIHTSYKQDPTPSPSPITICQITIMSSPLSPLSPSPSSPPELEDLVYPNSPPDSLFALLWSHLQIPPSLSPFSLPLLWFPHLNFQLPPPLHHEFTILPLLFPSTTVYCPPPTLSPSRNS
jgi:hypothetical protein